MQMRLGTIVNSIGIFVNRPWENSKASGVALWILSMKKYKIVYESSEIILQDLTGLEYT
jgi:hypothetical protein